MKAKYRDLVTVSATAGVAVIALPLDIGGAPLQVVLAALLVCFVPGYAVSAAALPSRRLELPVTLVLSFGTSLAITALGGLLLDLTPWGIGITSWSILLGGVAIGASAVAVLRRTDDWPLVAAQSGTPFRRGDRMYLGLAGVVTMVAVAIAYIGAASQEFPGYTQLWVVPSEALGKPATLRLEVSNQENAPAKYRLELQIEGKTIREWATIKLEASDEWATDVALPLEGNAGPKLVEALLYRLDIPDQVYRRVAVWQ